MIKKIISGGQTGADQAALDVAIEMGIPHGGWVPKGRKTENGRLSDRYRMQETNAIDYAQRTELNIIDSDATLLFSNGKLKGGSALTRRLAKKHNKPCLHIDLNELSEYKAVEITKSWIDVRGIETLNVAGPRASENPKIYDALQNVLRAVLFPPPESIMPKFPRTVREAVDKLVATMPMKEKTNIARMEENDLVFPNPSLWRHIRDRFGLGSGNEVLLNSCRYVSKKHDITEDEAASVIIKELWERLRKTHALRVLK
jgi:putative molybdenum carrier protein/uncharacterized protein DUF6794